MAVVAGAVLALLTLPFLFRATSNDLSRLQALYEAFEDRGSPEIVVLGNSVVMNGIDAELFSRDLPDSPGAWNLGSPGQIPLESLLITDQFGTDTQLAVLAVSVSELTSTVTDIDPRKYSAYHAYGYRPSDATIAIAEDVGAEATVALFRSPEWTLILASRWIARSSIDDMARNLLRSDLDLARATTDLFYPSPYREKVSTETLAKLLEENLPNRTGLTGVWSRGHVTLLSLIADTLQRRHIEFLLLVLPEHPAVALETGEDFYQIFDESLFAFTTSTGIEVVNARRLLPADRFIDNVHPDAIGAEALTGLVAERIVASFELVP